MDISQITPGAEHILDALHDHRLGLFNGPELNVLGMCLERSPEAGLASGGERAAFEMLQLELLDERQRRSAS